jgi:hypothetical protein
MRYGFRVPNPSGTFGRFPEGAGLGASVRLTPRAREPFPAPTSAMPEEASDLVRRGHLRRPCPVGARGTDVPATRTTFSGRWCGSAVPGGAAAEHGLRTAVRHGGLPLSPAFRAVLDLGWMASMPTGFSIPSSPWGRLIWRCWGFPSAR